LDFEETVITWGSALVLMFGADAFTVRHDPITLRSAVWRVPVLGLLGLSVAALATWAVNDYPSFTTVVRETGDWRAWERGPLLMHHHWIPLSVHLIECFTLLAAAYVVFRPIAAPRALPGQGARDKAAELVQAHGRDTLSFFKLRADKQYFFSDDRSAFVGYRI